MAYRCFVFDLDGTLVDTSPGILGSLRVMEQRLGLEPLPDDVIRRFIGPPLLDSMMQYYRVKEDEGNEMIRVYREIYAAGGIRQARVYPRVFDILKLLKEREVLRVVATLKQEQMAQKTLAAHDLAGRFDLVVGSRPADPADPGIPQTKGEQIAFALRELEVAPAEAVMIGDSAYDGVGAKDAGVDFIPQLYGFGFAHGEEQGDYPWVFAPGTPEEFWAFVQKNI